MYMDPGAGLYRFFGQADRISVFDHRFILGQITEGEFMSLGDIFGKSNFLMVNRNYGSRRQRTEGYSNLVRRMNFNVFLHFDLPPATNAISMWIKNVRAYIKLRQRK